MLPNTMYIHPDTGTTSETDKNEEYDKFFKAQPIQELLDALMIMRVASNNNRNRAIDDKRPALGIKNSTLARMYQMQMDQWTLMSDLLHEAIGE